MDGLRIVNRVVSMLLALALVVAGVLIAAEVVLAALDRDPWIIPHDAWYQRAQSTSWRDGDARLLFGALTLAGLCLLLLELLRRRAQAIPLAPRREAVRSDLDRRGLERWLSSRLSDVEGVQGTRAKVRKRGVAVSASTPQRDVADVERRLEEAAATHLGELGLAQPLRVKTKVSSRRAS